MISFIVTVKDKKILDAILEMELDKEIFVAYDGMASNEFVKVVETDLGRFIENSLGMCQGEKIVYVGAEIDEKTLEKIVKSSADIACIQRNKRHGLWKFLFHTFIPKTRKFKDPLSPVFSFKREVIGNSISNIITNPFPEIVTHARYKTMEIINYGKIDDSCMGKFRYLLYESKRNGELHRLLKFSIAGITSVIASEILLWFLLIIKIDLIIAGLASIELSILWSFVINDIWTFFDRRKKGILSFITRLIKYNALSIIGLIINVIILIVLSKFFGIGPLTANLIGMGVAFIWNFASNNAWTWLI